MDCQPKLVPGKVDRNRNLTEDQQKMKIFEFDNFFSSYFFSGKPVGLFVG